MRFCTHDFTKYQRPQKDWVRLSRPALCKYLFSRFARPWSMAQFSSARRFAVIRLRHLQQKSDEHYLLWLKLMRSGTVPVLHSDRHNPYLKDFSRKLYRIEISWTHHCAPSTKRRMWNNLGSFRHLIFCKSISAKFSRSM